MTELILYVLSVPPTFLQGVDPVVSKRVLKKEDYKVEEGDDWKDAARQALYEDLDDDPTDMWMDVVLTEAQFEAVKNFKE